MRVDSISPTSGSVLLVGCGAIGSVIARHLADSPAVSRLEIADLDGTLAENLGRSLPGKKTRAHQLDASDPAALAIAAERMDLVVNATVPRFNAGLQRAALAAKAHYVELACDSSDPFGPDAEWRGADRLAVLGLGEDPGLSNVMARFAADGMERVHAIRIRDGDTASAPDLPFVALFSPETFLEETLHSSLIYENGTYRTVPPFGEKEVYRFPAPVGEQPVYSVDHEEVDTLPRFIGKDVQYTDFKLALDDATVRTLMTLRDLRLMDRGPPGGPNPRAAVLAAIPKPAELAGRVRGHAALVVEVDGEDKAGRKEHQLYTLLDHEEAHRRYGVTATAYLTGTPAAVAVELILDGTIRERGMIPPERLPPRPILSGLKAKGVEVRERITFERAAV